MGHYIKEWSYSHLWRFRELVCFIVMWKLGLEIQPQHLQKDQHACSHGQTLFLCLGSIGWVSSLFPWICASSLSWKHAHGQICPSGSSCSYPSAYGTDEHVCYCLNFWEAHPLINISWPHSHVWSPLKLLACLNPYTGSPDFHVLPGLTLF